MKSTVGAVEAIAAEVVVEDWSELDLLEAGACSLLRRALRRAEFMPEASISMPMERLKREERVMVKRPEPEYASMKFSNWCGFASVAASPVDVGIDAVI